MRSLVGILPGVSTWVVGVLNTHFEADLSVVEPQEMLGRCEHRPRHVRTVHAAQATSVLRKRSNR